MRESGHLRSMDLKDPRLIDELKKASISPPRRLRGPYDNSVPFGTDRRMIDAIVSDETPNIGTICEYFHLPNASNPIGAY